MLLSQENYRIMREAMILRGAMVPYIYTHARTAHDTGIVYHIRILMIHVHVHIDCAFYMYMTTCICICISRFESSSSNVL